jgi:hypothetical protein
MEPVNGMVRLGKQDTRECILKISYLAPESTEISQVSDRLDLMGRSVPTGRLRYHIIAINPRYFYGESSDW